MIFILIYLSVAVAHIGCMAPIGKAIREGRLVSPVNLEQDFSHYFALVMPLILS